MALIHNLQSTSYSCFAVENKNIVVRTDGAQLTLADLQTLQAANVDTILFAEPEFQFCAVSLPSGVTGFFVKSLASALCPHVHAA